MLPELGFTDKKLVKGRASIADMYQPGQRCGIYILQFDNEEYYAGKAIDVTRRFVQHSKVHSDISTIIFKQVQSDRLDEEERTVIQTLERTGYNLRNIVFTSIPKGESDFDVLMPVEQQEQWLHGTKSDREASQYRVNDPIFRNKYRRTFNQFMESGQAEAVIFLLNQYVAQCIPIPNETEISFWSVTCCPAKNIFSRININWQEVLTIMIDQDELWISLHLAESPFEQHSSKSIVDKFNQYPYIEIYDHKYDPGGSDQINFVFAAEWLSKLLNDESAITAMRVFNLRLMKKGPCNFGRFHCMDLADRILKYEIDG